MKTAMFYFVFLTSFAANANDLVWTVTNVTENCIYGSQPVSVDDDVEGSSCKVEGQEISLIINGTGGYECDPVQEANLICCGDKISCDTISVERSGFDEY